MYNTWPYSKRQLPVISPNMFYNIRVISRVIGMDHRTFRKKVLLSIPDRMLDVGDGERPRVSIKWEWILDYIGDFSKKILHKIKSDDNIVTDQQ